ncbi:hypothetical protein [Streptomyces sp. NPDC048002]|uniref:effector-associated domain 2-containing protein n=1 Tax=Streptomyces sp. NPDC048002 TaxID=3154344 RepID=UPI0033FF33DC
MGARHGCGYRVGDRWVLSSAHLVGEAREACVRFRSDRGEEWTASARVALASAAAEAALLELTGPVPDACVPPAYGAAPRPPTALRVTIGTAPRTEGALLTPPDDRAHRLVLALEPELPHPLPDALCGAAVRHEDRLIGVVGAHRPADGPHRLTAVRVDRWYDLLSPTELSLLHTYAGLPATPAGLSGPPGLAHLPERLPLRELDGLVTALTEIPSVSDRDALTLILDSIDPVISAMTPRSPALRPDVFNILRTCLRYRGTLDQLLEAIRWVEGDSTGVARMDQEAVELSRRHR